MNKDFFYRSFELDRSTLNKEERSVDVSFSSETPVKRWFGLEILLHSPENVGLGRIRSMGAALMNHDPRMIIGTVKNVRIDGKRGVATIVFDDDEDGNKAFKKVTSGSLRGVSVGYVIEKFREIRSDEEWNGIKGPAYVATRWSPYEISLTPIPADHTVGVGREATRSMEGIEIENESSNKEQNSMTEEQIRAIMKEEQKGMVQTIVQEVRSALAEDQKPKMRVTPEEYNELLSRASAISPDAVVKFAGWAAEGKSSVEIQRSLLDMATSKPDARDPGAAPGAEGTGAPKPEAGKRKLADLDEDTFIRGLTNPMQSL